MTVPTFRSFRSTVTPFVPQPMPSTMRMLADPNTGAPTGFQSINAGGPDGIWTPVDLTAAQIAAPTADMLADLNATYRLNVAPYTRYQSDGSALVGLGGDTIVVPPTGSIQAALDALPATGGTIILSPSTTYTVTTIIDSTKNNVKITAPGWGTIVQRDPSVTTGALIRLHGTGCWVEHFTIDENSVVTTTSSALELDGDNSTAFNMNIINSAGTINLTLGGDNCRALYNRIVGLGTDPGLQTGYGIWAVNHKKVLIEGNYVTGTGIDGIAADGTGTRIINNHVENCHCYVAGGGGQINAYSGYDGMVISGNTIGTGGSLRAYGLEVNAPNATCIGNTILNSQWMGIVWYSNGGVIEGNVVLNSGQALSTFAAGLSIQTASITDLSVIGNTFSDTQATPTQLYGITLGAGAANRLVVTNNRLTRNTTMPFLNLSTGANQIVHDNLGIDDVTGAPGLQVVPAAGIGSKIINYSPLTVTASDPIMVFGTVSVRSLPA